MNLSEILSVTGLGGLFKFKGQRPNGIIVTDLSDGSHRFLSTRKHMFTTLDNITIYTENDNIPLITVFQQIKKSTEIDLLNNQPSNADLKSFFETIVPNYDKEKVYVSDIKKIFKWFRQLNDLDFDFFTDKEDDTEKETIPPEKNQTDD